MMTLVLVSALGLRLRIAAAAMMILAIGAFAFACTDEPTAGTLLEGRLIVGPDGTPIPMDPIEAIEPLPIDVTAVGDSVMLAAIGQLQGAGMTVDAEVSRGVPAAIEVLRGIARRGELGDEVLIHIGHNSVFTPAQLDEFVALAGGRPVTMLTVQVPLAWEQANNQVMRDGAARHQNLTVIEWEQLVASRPELFWDDGVHLRPEGAEFYARFVVAALK